MMFIFGMWGKKVENQERFNVRFSCFMNTGELLHTAQSLFLRNIFPKFFIFSNLFKFLRNFRENNFLWKF